LLVYRYKCTHERRNVVALSNKNRSLLQSTPLYSRRKNKKPKKQKHLEKREEKNPTKKKAPRLNPKNSKEIGGAAK